jgi:hypothetical protein
MAMDDVDADRVAAWLRAWWVETLLGAVALVGLVVVALDGDRLVGLLGVALALAVADRLRLRLDNRSLAAAVDEVREGRVSAARGGTPARSATDTTEPADSEGTETRDPDGSRDGEDGRDADDGVDRVGTDGETAADSATGSTAREG